MNMIINLVKKILPGKNNEIITTDTRKFPDRAKITADDWAPQGEEVPLSVLLEEESGFVSSNAVEDEHEDTADSISLLSFISTWAKKVQKASIKGESTYFCSKGVLRIPHLISISCDSASILSGLPSTDRVSVQDIIECCQKEEFLQLEEIDLSFHPEINENCLLNWYKIHDALGAQNPEYAHLKILNLSHTSLEDNGVSVLAERLWPSTGRGVPNLRELHLRDVIMTDVGFSHLCEAFSNYAFRAMLSDEAIPKDCPVYLEKLFVGDNYMTAASQLSFSHLITCSPKRKYPLVKNINLSGNSFLNKSNGIEELFRDYTKSLWYSITETCDENIELVHSRDEANAEKQSSCWSNASSVPFRQKECQLILRNCAVNPDCIDSIALIIVKEKHSHDQIFQWFMSFCTDLYEDPQEGGKKELENVSLRNFLYSLKFCKQFQKGIHPIMESLNAVEIGAHVTVLDLSYNLNLGDKGVFILIASLVQLEQISFMHDLSYVGGKNDVSTTITGVKSAYHSFMFLEELRLRATNLGQDSLDILTELLQPLSVFGKMELYYTANTRGFNVGRLFEEINQRIPTRIKKHYVGNRTQYPLPFLRLIDLSENDFYDNERKNHAPIANLIASSVIRARNNATTARVFNTPFSAMFERCGFNDNILFTVSTMVESECCVSRRRDKLCCEADDAIDPISGDNLHEKCTHTNYGSGASSAPNRSNYSTNGQEDFFVGRLNMFFGYNSFSQAGLKELMRKLENLFKDKSHLDVFIEGNYLIFPFTWNFENNQYISESVQQDTRSLLGKEPPVSWYSFLDRESEEKGKFKENRSMSRQYTTQSLRSHEPTTSEKRHSSKEHCIDSSILDMLISESEQIIAERQSEPYPIENEEDFSNVERILSQPAYHRDSQ